jgi:hypothetical protein
VAEGSYRHGFHRPWWRIYGRIKSPFSSSWKAPLQDISVRSDQPPNCISVRRIAFQWPSYIVNYRFQRHSSILCFVLQRITNLGTTENWRVGCICSAAG